MIVFDYPEFPVNWKLGLEAWQIQVKNFFFDKNDSWVKPWITSREGSVSRDA
jgi:hypothetical protein